MSQAGKFFDGTAAGNVEFLTGNTGGKVGADTAFNIDIKGLSGSGITLNGIPGTSTLNPSMLSPFNGTFDFDPTGTVTNVLDVIAIRNKANAASMIGTGEALVFDQFYYDATTPATAAAGRIATITETNWTSTASTQDAAMLFYTALNGVVNEKVRINSLGYMGIGTTSPSSLLDLEKVGTVTATTDILELTNSGNAASMSATGTGILFNQWYYDAGTPAVADAGRISVVTESNWTSTASTQDSYISFKNALNGTLTERLKIPSNGFSVFTGRIGINTDPASEFHIKTSNPRHSTFEGTAVTGAVYNGFQNEAGDSGLYGLDGNGLAALEYGAFLLGTFSAKSVIFVSNSTERVRITSDGYFGLNTTIAKTTLTVNGSQSINRTAVGAADYNPSVLTNNYLISFTDTAAARSCIISTEDEDSGTTGIPRIFIIKDESGNAGTNNITVTLESGGNIDGSASLVISSNYASITLYIDGTNAWLV